MELPDAASLDRLIVAARAGNAAAYSAFLSEAAGRLRGFLARRLGDDRDLEDLVQECLMALHERRDSLDPGRPVGPWMYAIARYKLADLFRRRARRPEGAEPASLSSPAPELAEADIEGLLGQLPEPQAEAVRLTQIEGLTGAEASDRVGIGHSAMKLRVHRGMARLRKMVSEKEK